MNDFITFNVPKHQYADVEFIDHQGFLLSQDHNVWTIVAMSGSSLRLTERKRLFGLTHLVQTIVDIETNEDGENYFTNSRASHRPYLWAWKSAKTRNSLMEYIRSATINAFGIVPLDEASTDFKEFRINKSRIRSSVMGNVTRSYSSFVTKTFKFNKVEGKFIMDETYKGQIRRVDPSELFGTPPLFDEASTIKLASYTADDGVVVEVLFEIASNYIKLALINNGREDFATDVRDTVIEWLSKQAGIIEIHNHAFNIKWLEEGNGLRGDIQVLNKEHQWTSMFSS